MATAAQQQAFAAQYGSYATQAGNQLGVDPNIILGQWGTETGWSTPASGNLAGISPGGKLASYSSPQDFTNAYVSTIQNNFPGATNTGSNAAAFNSGLVNGTYGSYYQGYDAQSKGLSTPTSVDQSNYLAGLQTAQNKNLIQYGGGDGSTSYGSGSTSLAANASVDGGSSYYDPQTGSYTSGLSPYQNVDGTTSSPSITSSNTGALSGGYVSGDGSYVPPQAIPGVTPSTTASPVVSSTGTGGTAGAVAGQPGVLLDQPFQFGLTTGLASAVNTWITGIETAVGNWMTKALGDVFGSVVNYAARAGLIVLGLILVTIALWRLLDPSGEKTKAVSEHVAAMAA